MSRIAFVFPGQGAQYVGMAKDIADTHSEAMEVFDIASNRLGYDIADLVFNGPEEKLKITKYTQPAILTASWAVYKALEKYGFNPDVTAGLSLGEFTAHVLAGSLDFSDAVALVEKRGIFMQEAVPEGVGGMTAVLGLDEETVEGVCREASDIGYVACANYNCPGQIVISGELPALEKAGEILSEKGAKRVIPLKVSAPFHCNLLKGAGDKLKAELENVEIGEMKIPVYANVTGKEIAAVSDIKGLLVDQVSNTVKWTNVIRNMIDSGIDTFIEIGPGKVLSGLIKKTDRSVRIANAENAESLEKAVELLGTV